MADDPRPQKRARTTPPTDICSSKNGPESELHGAQLLLALPSLLVHPPTHSDHKEALCVSLLALRRCLGLFNPGGDRVQGGRKSGGSATTLDISQPDECRAWCALAEIGLCVLEGGFGAEAWAMGIESEVEKALGKAFPIAQKHPSLASYPPYLTRLSVRAAPHRARQLLRPVPTATLVSSATTNAAGITAYYYTHLAWTDHLLQGLLYPEASSRKVTLQSCAIKLKSFASTPIKPSPLREKEIARNLAALRFALSPLLSAHHVNMALLARVIELRALIAVGRWTEVGVALHRAETAVGITIPAPRDAEPPQYTTSPFSATLAVHVLVLGIVWFSYSATPAPAPVASAANATRKEASTGSTAVSARLTLLYSLLDAGVYNGKTRAANSDGENMALESEGVLEVPLDTSTLPLYIRTTHPRVLYALGYLISAIARRDLAGRKPGRKVFVIEGLGVVDREAGRELRVPRWATAGDVHAVELQMAKIKADLMCELIAVSIMRSEFDDAERTLDAVIAHARTHGLFGGALAHRITLLHAQLAHALGRSVRARTCYRVAAQLAQDADDAGGMVAARAGEVALLVGIRARAQKREGGRGHVPLAEEPEFADVGEAELAQMGREVAVSCRGLGGAMCAVGQVLEGVLTTEILKAKQHFRNALTYATECQDNHLRALILALITAHYLHTAGDQVQKMVGTCEQLAACLGVVGKRGLERVDAVGNAYLRLWAGERFLELHTRDGRDDLVQAREEENELLRQAVTALSRRS